MVLLLMYRTNAMQLVNLLLMTILTPTVTTFSPLEWIKDKVGYEHCGSVWINPDINGKHNFMSNKAIVDIRLRPCCTGTTPPPPASRPIGRIV